jgi:beta-phosphoglucomutase-like phosphatase (HAD superfamily)
MSLIQGIAFDFNGVLADSEAAHNKARVDAFVRFGDIVGRPEFSEVNPVLHENALLHGTRSEQIITWVLRNSGVEFDSSDVETITAIKKARFDQIAADGLPAYDGGIEFVGRVGSLLGFEHNGIASGSNKEHHILPFLNKHGLIGCFGAVVAKEDTPRNRGKPHPYAYYRLAQILHLDSAYMLGIENTPDGVLASSAALGVTVAITTTHPKEALKQAGADFVVDTFVQLSEIVGNLYEQSAAG